MRTNQIPVLNNRPVLEGTKGVEGGMIPKEMFWYQEILSLWKNTEVSFKEVVPSETNPG